MANTTVGSGSGRSVGKVPVAVLLLLAGCGLVLVALPWLPHPEPIPVQGEIRPGDPVLGVLRRAARAADRACAAGDVEALRGAVTEAAWRDLTARGESAGTAVDADVLRQIGDLVGTLDDDRLLCGAAGGDAAVLVFRRRTPALSPAGQRLDLRAVVFRWTGSAFRVDRTRRRAVAAGEQVEAAGRAWLTELLAR